MVARQVLALSDRRIVALARALMVLIIYISMLNQLGYLKIT